MPNLGYLVLESCGCFVGYEPKKSPLLTDWLSWGLTIERVSRVEAQKVPYLCAMDRAKYEAERRAA